MKEVIESLRKTNGYKTASRIAYFILFFMLISYILHIGVEHTPSVAGAFLRVGEVLYLYFIFIPVMLLANLTMIVFLIRDLGDEEKIGKANKFYDLSFIILIIIYLLLLVLYIISTLTML